MNCKNAHISYGERGMATFLELPLGSYKDNNKQHFFKQKYVSHIFIFPLLANHKILNNYLAFRLNLLEYIIVLIKAPYFCNFLL